MSSDRGGLYATSAILAVGGFGLGAGALTLPVWQTIFGSEALVRATALLYAVSFLVGGALLVVWPRLGCLFPVAGLVFCSIVILVGLNAGLPFRVGTAL